MPLVSYAALDMRRNLARQRMGGCYQETPAEAKMLRAAMVIALETGTPKIVMELHTQMVEHFADEFPVVDPEAVDKSSRKPKEPVFNYLHLLDQPRVYTALKEWHAALADAGEVVRFLTSKGDWMSMRPEAFNETGEFLYNTRKRWRQG